MTDKSKKQEIWQMSYLLLFFSVLKRFSVLDKLHLGKLAECGPGFLFPVCVNQPVLFDIYVIAFLKTCIVGKIPSRRSLHHISCDKDVV